MARGIKRIDASWQESRGAMAVREIVRDTMAAAPAGREWLNVGEITREDLDAG
jgi:hypothetical protein